MAALPGRSRWLNAALAPIIRARATGPGHLASLPPASRRTLYAAVFSIFTAVGFTADLLRGSVGPAASVLLMAVFSGLLAILYVYVVIHHMRWFPLLIVAHVVVLMSGVFDLFPSVPLEQATPAMIRGKLLLDGVGCVVAFTVSYATFMTFIGIEGTRYARAHAEIELAREIHQLLVPAVDRVEGEYEFYGLSAPSAEVGGDLVDVTTLDGRWLGYVADVSGHGVGAGLLMAILKSGLRTRALSGGSVDDLLTDLNEILVPLSKPNMYATLALLHDAGGGQMAFSVAGHPPILRYRAATQAVEELTVPQIPLGVFAGRRFTSATLPVEPGDLFVIVTDGLTDVFDSDGREFGFDRFRELVAGHAHRPLREIADAVIADVRRHGPQADDQTLLLVRAADVRHEAGAAAVFPKSL